MNRFIASAAILVTLTGAARAGAAELHAHVVDHHGKALHDAVVLAVPVDPKAPLKIKSASDAVDQVDKQFVPFVKAVMVGSKVRFPNSDHVRHQVYSFSPAKSFELPLYAGTTAPPVLFDKPGVVVLGCNIHDWMVGYIYVSRTPYFATTDVTGSAVIGDLPPGEYTVSLWHPGMDKSEESTARHTIVGADAPAMVNFDIAIKPSFRVPRVTGAASPAYR